MHTNAKTRLEVLKNPNVVIPDIGTGNLHVIELRGTRPELHYVGGNHSDNSLVMLLPKEMLLFTVDFIPIESLQFRDFPDGFLPDFFDSADRVLALAAGDEGRRARSEPVHGRSFRC